MSGGLGGCTGRNVDVGVGGVGGLSGSVRCSADATNRKAARRDWWSSVLQSCAHLIAARREPPCWENQAVCDRAQAWATRKRGPSKPRSPSSNSHCEASASRPGGASWEDLPFSARRTMSAALSASFASFVDLNVSIPRAMILPLRSDVARRANNASRRFDTASVFRQISSKASTRLCLLTRGSCTGGGGKASEPYAGGLIFVEDGCSAAS